MCGMVEGDMVLPVCVCANVVFPPGIVHCLDEGDGDELFS